MARLNVVVAADVELIIKGKLDKENIAPRNAGFPFAGLGSKIPDKECEEFIGGGGFYGLFLPIAVDKKVFEVWPGFDADYVT